MRITGILNLAILCSLVVVTTTGCSDSSENSETAENLNTVQSPNVQLTTNSDGIGMDSSTSSTADQLANEDSPQRIVQNFLAALQLGNDATISNLLTTRARQETEKHDLVVRSPGSPNATFEVGEVEMVSGGAYVTSLWKEPGKDGLTHQFDIIWILRQQQNGWRIAGMATRVTANEAPTYLNFEDPEEMIRIWKAADQRLATQQEQGAATAGN